ncbi:MAG: hypothetical protein JW725_03290 [Candidatus Babeliaceae bacterium]|nr:hypothetical protein [Candidatus Babeliaceae bacterium]
MNRLLLRMLPLVLILGNGLGAGSDGGVALPVDAVPVIVQEPVAQVPGKESAAIAACRHITAENVQIAQEKFAHQVRKFRCRQFGIAGGLALMAGGLGVAVWKLFPFIKNRVLGPTTSELEEKIDQLQERIKTVEEKCPGMVRERSHSSSIARKVGWGTLIGGFALAFGKLLAVEAAKDIVIGVPRRALENSANNLASMALSSSLNKGLRYLSWYPRFANYANDNTLLFDKITRVELHCAAEEQLGDIDDLRRAVNDLVDEVELVLGFLKFFAGLKSDVSGVCVRFGESIERKMNQLADSASQGNMVACSKELQILKYDIALCIKHL